MPFLALLALQLCSAAPTDIATDLLWESVQSGSVEDAEKAISMGAHLNEQRRGKQTPIMAASLGGKAEIIEVLLKAGADTSIPEADGYTPLHGAAFQVGVGGGTQQEK